MSIVEVKKTKFSKLGNKYFPLILINQQVDPSAASFLLQRYDKGFSLNTVYNEARVIKKFYQFCLMNDLSFIKRMKQSEHLTVGEIEALASYYSARHDTGEVVTSSTFKLRWITTKKFIDFLWSFYASRTSNSEDISSSEAKKRSMDATFKTLGKTPYHKPNPDRVGLEHELKVKLLAIINPIEDNRLNPWNDKFHRWRNYCLLLTMIMGGIRKGEALGLKLRHFHLLASNDRKNYFSVKKEAHTDYPHKETPSAKTLERDIYLTPDLASLFEYYITKIRPQARNYRKSEYVFISLDRGLPLSISTPNDILAVIKNAYPEFKDFLSPHRLRNTYFDMLHDQLYEAYNSQGPVTKKANMDRALQYSGGWAAGSSMPERYAKGSIQRKVSEFSLLLQSQLSSENNKNGK